ncbi:hypothetical protein [Marinospirillum alkaliphilum]|uniref:Uncharacterized protein n=1 Tax=Marinospirillum alkaliphilum DSM 21637 TaxID=1122209 RepID=A0A1K1ZTD6_9GAMM|nr:hypothetical protein [Marinospirillum alkaliphilum]SFX76916.1 hypothetical protein SAMN02745752_02816 [Marinospirillum alkaliphilum DSM 21637]
MTYYTLVTALPHLPPLPQCKELPISRIALDRRLSMLSDADRQQLQQAERLYHQGDVSLQSLPDQTLVRDWQQQLQQLESPLIRERIQLKLEWQTLLAALRYRQQGRIGPEHFSGFGRWTGQIRRHWHEPLFGLDTALPFLAELQPLLLKGHSGELEQQLNAWLWKDLLFIERSVQFTLDTVICFVLRWGLTEKHLKSDAVQALEAFQHLTSQLLNTPAITQHIESAFEDLS